MHTIPDYEPKIRLISQDGDTWTCDNIRVAAQWFYELGLINRYSWKSNCQIGINFKEFRTWLEIPYYYQYIVRSEFGDIITVDELRKHIVVKCKHVRWRDPEHGYVYRRDPVPNIRHGCGKYRWYRHPKTTAERRENDALIYDEDAIEYGIKVRGRRKNHSLPNAWDDYCRGWQKSWKKHRKHQWKEKK